MRHGCPGTAAVLCHQASHLHELRPRFFAAGARVAKFEYLESRGEESEDISSWAAVWSCRRARLGRDCIRRRRAWRLLLTTITAGVAVSQLRRRFDCHIRVWHRTCTSFEQCYNSVYVLTGLINDLGFFGCYLRHVPLQDESNNAPCQATDPQTLNPCVRQDA